MPTHNFKDIIGKRFGRLVTIEPTPERYGGEMVWKCQCDCAKIVLVVGGSLRSGHTKSCGCLQKRFARKQGLLNAKDIRGRKFGRLTALESTDKKQHSNYFWKCKCDCGSITFVSISHLTRGTTRSCGCLKVAADFTKNTDIDPMDVPFEITNLIKANREVKRAIKQAS